MSTGAAHVVRRWLQGWSVSHETAARAALPTPVLHTSRPAGTAGAHVGSTRSPRGIQIAGRPWDDRDLEREQIAIYRVSGDRIAEIRRHEDEP